MSYDIEFYEENAITPGENDYVFAEYNLSYNYSRFLSQWRCYPRDCSSADYAIRCGSLLQDMTGEGIQAAVVERSWNVLVKQDNEWNTRYAVIQYLDWVVRTSKGLPGKKMRCIG